MSRPLRDDDDAYVEQLARKLETVPPRRDPSGVFPRAEDDAPAPTGRDASDAED